MSTMHSATLRVPRTAHYHVLGDVETAREAWFVLHGYGQHAADFLASFEPIAGPERLLVAPEGLSRLYLEGGGGPTGASWMTRADREDEIADYLEWLDRLRDHVLGVRDLPLHVLGFSQGAATACRWAASGRARAARLTLWAGGVPPDVDLASCADLLRALDTTLVVGERDGWITPARLQEEVERLAAHGLALQNVSFAGGHRLDDDTLRGLADGA